MQKRVIRKLDLELFLSQIAPHPSPSPNLEQYTIDVNTAATMLYIAAYNHNGIIGKNILDLGCGTGRLALGAAFLGAKQVVGLDIDSVAIKSAFENAVKTGLKEKLQLITADIDVIHGSFDTILQNPPFGVQKRKIDCKFLKKALEVGNHVYSLHKSMHKSKSYIKMLKANKVLTTLPSPFFENFVRECGGEIKAVYSMVMEIPHMFSFHKKIKHEFVVDLYVIEKTN